MKKVFLLIFFVFSLIGAKAEFPFKELESQRDSFQNCTWYTYASSHYSDNNYFIPYLGVFDDGTVLLRAKIQYTSYKKTTINRIWLSFGYNGAEIYLGDDISKTLYYDLKKNWTSYVESFDALILANGAPAINRDLFNAWNGIKDKGEVNITVRFMDNKYNTVEFELNNEDTLAMKEIIKAYLHYK